MNPQLKGRANRNASRTDPRRKPQQAPHRRSPSDKQPSRALPGHGQNDAAGQKPLPVAKPVRTASRPTKPHQTASQPVVDSRSARSLPAKSFFNVGMAFTVFGFAVAGVLVVLFGLDLAMAVPLQRVSPLMDVTYLLCGITLGWLSWSCYCDQS